MWHWIPQGWQHFPMWWLLSPLLYHLRPRQRFSNYGIQVSKRGGLSFKFGCRFRLVEIAARVAYMVPGMVSAVFQALETISPVFGSFASSSTLVSLFLQSFAKGERLVCPFVKLFLQYWDAYCGFWHSIPQRLSFVRAIMSEVYHYLYSQPTTPPL